MEKDPEEKVKRSVSPSEVTSPNKKVRLSFSGKEFRKEIKSPKKIQAFQGFLQLIEENSKHDCILTYLEDGGSALEILQSMDGESTVPPVLIFEIVNHILLQVNARIPKYANQAIDWCRYLLSSYVTLINKMLGLSSSAKERVVTLKLLATIVTFSVGLAKTVLLNVNFNPTNLQLLTKVHEGKREVRTAFIHFITAFLVDGHFPALVVLLEKKGLMTSIIRDLKFDDADVVVLVITAMKNHILENESVTKTSKMKTFNTAVVRDIVNLYNWKGPEGLSNANNQTKAVRVDEVAKSKVNEAVHAFLLVLCTSHRYGVIFKDPLGGLSTKQNSLMETVLDSLVRPWDHSYASELVLKICRSCPDLVKKVWNSLRESLEPRWTDNWLSSMKFANLLLDELQPECMELAVNNLNVHQVTQVITNLVVPPSILKIVLKQSFDKPAIKHRVLTLLLKMAQSIEVYLNRSKTWPKIDHKVVSTALANQMCRCFPDVNSIVDSWDKIDENSPVADRLDVALDLLEKYKILAPQMLHNSVVNFDMKRFLTRTDDVAEGTQLRRLQVKAIHFFLDVEPRTYRLQSDLFQTIFSFSLEFYHGCKGPEVLKVLHDILKNSHVFDGHPDEMEIWIDGVLNLKSYDETVASFLCQLMKNVDDNAANYDSKLFELNGNFSPLLLSLDEYFAENKPPKHVKNYLNFVVLNLFHLQAETSAFVGIVSKWGHISDELVTYVKNWNSGEFTPLEKCKGKLLDMFHKFSTDFFENTLENFDVDLYCNAKLDLLRASVFYLTNLMKAGALKVVQVEKFFKFVDYLIAQNAFDEGRYAKTILGNPALLRNLNIFDPNEFSTKLVLKVVKNSKGACVGEHLVELQRKILSCFGKIFRKPQKFQNLVVSIEVVETVTLEYEQCCKLLEKFLLSEENRIFYRVACYCLDRMAQIAQYNLSLEPLSNEAIGKLSQFLIVLIREQTPNLHHLSTSLLNYLRVFPHNIEGVENEVFSSLVAMPEYNKENLAVCEFLLDRKPEMLSLFEQNLDEICSKRSFLLAMLDIVVKQVGIDGPILEKIFHKFESHIVKALQKPHKAGQHFQSRYKSVGVLVEKFMKPEGFGSQVQKFETSESFHVFLLKKVYDKVEKSDKVLSNMIMTFVHLLVNLLKQKGGGKTIENVGEVGGIFLEFLRNVPKQHFDLGSLSGNETLKMFCKLCLKYGVGGDVVLVEVLSELVELCVVEEDGKLILEMLFSHSQFLEVVLGNCPKNELLHLWRTICTRWPQFMERSHVPVILSAYQATRADSTVLTLLRMYESEPKQTQFFDFKPFLWGRAAASHYSVRSDVQVLWRQPKIIDVLNNLHLPRIAATIDDPTDPHSYDLDYFLPLFSNLLSPENPMPTYRFTRSGALALALTGLRGNKTHRLATCHVLQRFYFHLEAKQSGKDNLVWLRFVEAICKGIAVLDDFKINNFVGVFLARTALVLSQPKDVMFVPLSQYLTAKDSLNFETIPELYTFLHSPDVDSAHHKQFILEVLRVGLRTQGDFTILLNSMGFKLISELCSSTVSQPQEKISILKVFKVCCESSFGVNVLCGSLSFLTQMFGLVAKNIEQGAVLVELLQVLLKVVEVDADRRRNFLVYLNLLPFSEDNHYFRCLVESRSLSVYYRILQIVVDRFPEFFAQEHMTNVLKKSGDKFCEYLVKYGCKFVKEDDFSRDADSKHLRLLFYNKLMKQ